MNLYLVSRSECGYDQYSDFVVAAKTAEDALAHLDKNHNAADEYSSWPNEGTKTAELIGTTNKYTETTEILGSFHAG